MNAIDVPQAYRLDGRMTISKVFEIGCGEIRLTVSAPEMLEANTCYVLCVRGIQAVLNDELQQQDEDQP